MQTFLPIIPTDLELSNRLLLSLHSVIALSVYPFLKILAYFKWLYCIFLFLFSTTQIEQLVEGLIGIGDKNGDKRITFDEYVHMSHDVFVNNFAPRNLRRVFRNYWSLNAQFIQGPLKIRTEHHFYMIFQLRGKNGDLNCIPGFDFWTTTFFFTRSWSLSGSNMAIFWQITWNYSTDRWPLTYNNLRIRQDF